MKRLLAKKGFILYIGTVRKKRIQTDTLNKAQLPAPKKRASGSGRSTIRSHVSDLPFPQESFTVIDSPGLAPDSMFRLCGWSVMMIQFSSIIIIQTHNVVTCCFMSSSPPQCRRAAGPLSRGGPGDGGRGPPQRPLRPPPEGVRHPQQELRHLYDGEGPQGCFATDRILVDGCRVGYCYREEPEEGTRIGIAAGASPPEMRATAIWTTRPQRHLSPQHPVQLRPGHHPSAGLRTRHRLVPGPERECSVRSCISLTKNERL